jgi:pantothenate synthetase
MSSRNARLSANQRKSALVFYKGLQKAKTLLQARVPFDAVQKEIKQFCESQPEIKLEYLALADSTNLSLIKSVTSAKYFADCRLCWRSAID